MGRGVGGSFLDRQESSVHRDVEVPSRDQRGVVAPAAETRHRLGVRQWAYDTDRSAESADVG